MAMPDLRTGIMTCWTEKGTETMPSIASLRGERIAEEWIQTNAGWRLWPGHANQGLEAYSVEAARKVRESIDQKLHEYMVGNRQRMMPVEYIVTEGPRPYGFGSIFVRGIVTVDGQKVGNWTTNIVEKHFDAVKKDLTEREQPMSKSLFEVYVVNKGKFVDVWTGIASTGENARFKAISELGIDTDIENLDTFTRVVGNLRDDCCK